jgi:hypothetical protein
VGRSILIEYSEINIYRYRDHSLKNAEDLDIFLTGAHSAIFILTEIGDFDTLASSTRKEIT